MFTILRTSFSCSTCLNLLLNFVRDAVQLESSVWILFAQHFNQRLDLWHEFVQLLRFLLRCYTFWHNSWHLELWLPTEQLLMLVNLLFYLRNILLDLLSFHHDLQLLLQDIKSFFLHVFHWLLVVKLANHVGLRFLRTVLCYRQIHV